MKIPKLLNLSAVALVVWLVLAGVAFASPIIYTFTGTGSGTVNSVPFTNAVYTITLYGDTTTITHNPNGDYGLTATTATMGITGVGTAAVTDPVWIFDGPNAKSLGIGRNGPGNMLVLSGDAAFATYDLATALGPITSFPSLYMAFQDLQTNLGPITLASSGSVTFQAVLGNPPVTWTGDVSIPWKITIESKDTTGDTKFKNLSSSFTGTMEIYNGENGLQPNTEGCYARFSGDDGSAICIKEIISISTDIKKSKTDQFFLIGAGTMTMMLEGSPLAGIAYLDSKGTLKKVGEEISVITVSGKIGGGGAGGTDQAFVLSGNVKTTLTKQVD